MKNGDLTFVYGAVAVLSVLLMLSYLLWERKKEHTFLFLSGCVATVNCGYFLLSIARSVPFAMIANGVSYSGAAYSVLAMMLIICDVCQIRRRRLVRVGLLTVSTAAFLLAASGKLAGWRSTAAPSGAVAGTISPSSPGFPITEPVPTVIVTAAPPCG